MRALIPVGGEASRLRPHTLLHPRALLPVAGKPVLAHIVERLIEDGIQEILFVVGPGAEQIERFVRRHFSIQAQFVRQEEPLGLGHAVYVARQWLSADQPFVIVLGDTIYDADLKPVFEAPYTSIGIKEVEDPSHFGVAVINERGFITRLVEKPQEPVSRLALVGIYFIKNPALLFNCLAEVIEQKILVNNQYQLTDALQRMIEKGEPITAFNVEGWYDCDRPANLLRTNQILLQSLNWQPGDQIEESTIVPPVFIHPEARVIRSVVGPNVSIGAGTVVERSIVQHSIVGQKAHLQHALVEYSLIGDQVKLRGRLQRINLGDFSEWVG
ncbi:MAG: nucleotidyl transferase [Calditrichaeota bacterium]|nr:MAG: nucleotidyl transferase [Calditrichota bacterium]